MSILLSLVVLVLLPVILSASVWLGLGTLASLSSMLMFAL